MNNNKKGILLSILSSSLSISPVLFKLTLNTINPETTNLLQTLFSSILFIFLFIILRKKVYFDIILKNWKMPAAIAFFVFVGGLLFTYGILYSGPTTASFLIQFTYVFTIFLGVVFLKEKFTELEGIGILLAITGLFVLSYGNIKIELFSNVILLIASIAFAISNLLSKIYLKDFNPVALAGGRSMFIFIFFLMFSLLSGKLETNIPIITLGYMFLAAITGVFLNFILSYKSLELIEVSKAMAISSIGPFFTVFYSYIMLSLIPTMNQLLGGTLIVIAIIILIISK